MVVAIVKLNFFIVKVNFLFLTFFIAVFLSSGIPSEYNSIKEDESIPEITIKNNHSEYKLINQTGKILVHFWTYSNPSSRIENIKLANIVSSLPDNNITFVSICTDTDRLLQDELIRNDQISNKGIFINMHDLQEDLYNKFNISDGNFTSYLIDNGTIIAINPSEKEISKLI